MKFSDIDFSALKHMVDSLSDEEKESLNNMARNMAANMNGSMNEAATAFEQNLEDTESSVDYIEYLHIPESLADQLDGHTLSMLENASDFEQYYEDVEDADLSGAVLYYTKALLSLARLGLAKKLAAYDAKFEKPERTTLYDYAYALNQPEMAEKLADEITSAADYQTLGSSLMQMYLFLQRAEHDFMSKRDVQILKDQLIEQGLLEKMQSFLN